MKDGYADLTELLNGKTKTEQFIRTYTTNNVFYWANK